MSCAVQYVILGLSLHSYDRWLFLDILPCFRFTDMSDLGNFKFVVIVADLTNYATHCCVNLGG